MNMQADAVATPSKILLLTKPALPENAPKDDWYSAWPVIAPLNALQWPAENLREWFKENNTLAVHWPVFSLNPVADGMSLLHGHLAQLRQQTDCSEHMLVMVSPSALLLASPYLKPWPNKLWCGVMGQQSAAVAQRLGIPKACLVYPGCNAFPAAVNLQEDSMGLAHIISQQFSPTHSKLLVAKGPQGRTEYLQHLRQLGFACETLDIYERKPIPTNIAAYHALLNIIDTHHATIKVVIWFSSSDAVAVWAGALKQLTPNQAGRLLQCVVAIATHNAIAKQCRKTGFMQVVQTAPGIQSVQRCLQQI